MKSIGIIRPVIVLLWLITMGVLLRYEAYPHWFTRTVPGYRGIVSDTLLARESWARILIEGEPAGYSHSSLGINDETPENLMEINNRVHLRIRILGQIRRVFAQTLVALNRDFELESFEMSITAGELTAQATGRRLQRGVFELSLQTGDRQMLRTVEIPPDTLVYSPLQELALRQLRPGGKLTLKTFNPLTQQASRIMIEAVGREPVNIGGTVTETIRLRSEWQGLSFDSWMTADGTLVRQETPIGWVMEACSAEEALASVNTSENPPAVFGISGGFFLNLLTGRRNP